METFVEKAAVSFPSDREVEVRRSFRAPRALVYRAYTEPALVRQWMLGPGGWSMPICEMDVRPGGSYRWRWRSDDGGGEFGFYGTFQEVEAPSLLVHTESFDPGTQGGSHGDGPPAVVTTVFADEGEWTTVTMTMDFGSKATRDAVVATGMTDGMEKGHQRLDQLLADGNP